MFIPKGELFEMLRMERESIFDRCREDLAWALSMPKTTSWAELITQTKAMDEAIRTDFMNKMFPKN